MKFTIKKITYSEHLKDRSLCSGGIKYFKRKFPKGMPVSRKNIMSLEFDYFQYWLYRYNHTLWNKWIYGLKDGYTNEFALKTFCDKFLPTKK